jgi:hypothetical protein
MTMTWFIPVTCKIIASHIKCSVLAACVLWPKRHSQTLWRRLSTFSRLGSMQDSMSLAVPETDVAIWVSNPSNSVNRDQILIHCRTTVRLEQMYNKLGVPAKRYRVRGIYQS